jgi:predicted regulator of Ras-like GTPase activity (Roadblock/LC7/MglB family)
MTAGRDGNTGELRRLLGELLARSGALTGLLVSKDGVSVAESGDISYLSTTAMAALVAGMFSATREVARMVGEEQFSMLLQQGENRHIHISLIQDSKMMVVIFEGYERIGRVRHEARRIAGEIAKVLSAQEQPSPHTDKIGTTQFKEYALNAIDRIFQTR